MWAAALVSLAFCLIAIWSIGSLHFFIPCLQLASAIGLRRRANAQDWVLLLAGAVLVFLLVIYGFALLHAQSLWVIAWPLVLVVGSIPLLDGPTLRRS